MSAHGGWGGDVEAIGKTLDALRRLLAEEVSGRTLLQRLCEWAVDAVSGAEMAGVVLSYGAGGSGSVACTDPRIASIEGAQIRTGMGPGPVAADTCAVLRGEFGEGWFGAGPRWRPRLKLPVSSRAVFYVLRCPWESAWDR